MGKKTVWTRMLCLLLGGGLLGAMLPGALPQAAAASRQVKITIASVKNCDVYYCEGNALIPIEQNGQINKTTTGNYGIILFAAPHEGYALSAMSATNSAGDYFTISDGEPNGAGSEFYANRKNIDNLKNAGYTDAQIERILTEAIAKSCDGALLFSRPASATGAITSNLMFCAEKLPTLAKKIDSVTPKGETEAKEYEAGMSVGLGDVINYSLDVTFYKLENKNFAIDYSDVYITDEKTGNTGDNKVSVTAPTAAEQKNMAADQVVQTEVKYTITQQDVEQGTVVNQAQLSYQYKSLHSKGQLATTSDAKAEITVHASVSYKYESATEDMELPAELAALAPTDYTYHNQGELVTTKLHAQSPYWDAANGGYWTLQNNGKWSGINGKQGVAAGGTFTMSNTPVTLTAKWAFTKAPAIAVEKNGSIQNAPANGKEGDTVSYTANYTISINNTGGEPLNTFTICDETLPQTGITASIGGTQITLEGLPYDSQTHTLTVTLQGSGLAVGETLTLSYSCDRRSANQCNSDRRKPNFLPGHHRLRSEQRDQVLC